MSRRFWLVFAVVCSSFASLAQPALAQQTFNVSLGYFTPRGQDARVTGDVLNANRNFLEFDVKDFNGASIGGEWLFPVGRYIEAGAGVSFTRKTVPTVYSRLLNANGSEIEQELRLRMIPAALTFRVLPLGQDRGFQPYIGGGLGLISWRYSESGQFVDTRDSSIFNNSYSASGTKTGPVAMGGIRFAGDSIATGFEVRYQAAEADLAPPFAGPKLDLGGWSYLFTLGARFGR
jgi:opacity protein-like surface antigen